MLRILNKCKNAFEQIIKKHKKVDCLINCAGVWIKGPIEENSPEEIKNVIFSKYFWDYFDDKYTRASIKKQKHGRIINVSSQAGLTAKSERSVYNASKWAVTGFTKCMQLELAPHNISVVGFLSGVYPYKYFGKAEDKRTDF